MRNLTLKRTKSFVASLGTMKVYIEDPMSAEMTIQGVECRKLCELKNGEEKTVEISEDTARVYVIADKLSKNYCNEFYELPAGTDDIYLSGKNHFNPGAGNPFRFDGNTNEAVLQNRKKNGRKGLIILCLAMAIGIVIGTFVGKAVASAIFAESPKTFASNGMEITLTNEFREAEFEGFTVCYDSPNAAVFALKEPFSLAEGLENYTLEQYGKLVLANNGMEDFPLYPMGSNYCFEFTYTDPTTAETFYYVSVVYRSQDAFWLIQFAVPEENFDDYADTIQAWATSVTFQ